MKVFIGWSGDRSRIVSETLRDWLPNVINAVEPWMSEEDIAKGAHWPSALGRELDQAKFGIICLTAENLQEPWILFEAGVLCKSFDQARVSPYLFGIENRDIRPPLSHFQATKAEKEESRKLLRSINEAVKDSGEKHLEESRLNTALDKWWPDLEEKLRRVPTSTAKVKKREDREILEEILALVRSLAKPQNLPGFRSLADLLRFQSPPETPVFTESFRGPEPQNKTATPPTIVSGLSAQQARKDKSGAGS